MVTVTTTGEKRTESRTLDQFDAAIDEYLGRTAMFASTVRALNSTRAEAAAVNVRRREIFEVLCSHYERGDRIAGSGNGRQLRRTNDVTRIVRSVPSAAVKKAHPALWEQARVMKPFVQAASPRGYDTGAVYRLVAVPDGRNLFETMSRYDELGPRSSRLRETEKALVDRLTKIGMENNWDGAPIAFADGWKVSLCRLEYSSDRLALIAPEVFESLAVENEQTTSGRVYISEGTDYAEYDGYAE